MVTTAEFKRLHGLSDSTFKRLVNKIKTDHPGLELVKRTGSTEWEILEIDLFNAAIAARKPKVETTESEPIAVEVAIVPSEVQQLSTPKTDRLDSLLAQYEKPKAFNPIQMNGFQDKAIDIVETLAATHQQMKQENDRIAADIEGRAANLDKLKEVALNIGAGVKSEMERNQQIQESAELLQRKESELKKTLQNLMDLL